MIIFSGKEILPSRVTLEQARRKKKREQDNDDSCWSRTKRASVMIKEYIGMGARVQSSLLV